MRNFQVFAIRLSEDDVQRLDQVAREKQVSRSAVIRWAIEDYLKSFYLPDCPIDSPNGLDIGQPTELQPA